MQKFQMNGIIAVDLKNRKNRRLESENIEIWQGPIRMRRKVLNITVEMAQDPVASWENGMGYESASFSICISQFGAEINKLKDKNAKILPFGKKFAHVFKILYYYIV